MEHTANLMPYGILYQSTKERGSKRKSMEIRYEEQNEAKSNINCVLYYNFRET